MKTTMMIATFLMWLGAICSIATAFWGGEQILNFLIRKYGNQWHIEKLEHELKLWRYKWEAVDSLSYPLEDAVIMVNLLMKQSALSQYRLRNWRTKEIIPGEILDDGGPRLNYEE